MKFRLLAIATIASVLFYSCSQNQQRNPSGSREGRGNEFDYDAGASLDSKWADLFADTPNYRAFGKAIIGGSSEKFRWIMGPMWYRGRLEENQVKVFVIGQEGAQDENVSNRSFTGSTGTRMQKFINYFGITESYLFMNTFVYTITGQYSLFGEDANDPGKVLERDRLIWLAQDEKSVVVKHRHELFDYMLERNKNTLSVVVGVGTAGKESAATWARHHDIKCSAGTLTKSYCYGTTGALKGVLVIGVPHPGAASERNGGEDAMGNLTQSFRDKAMIVKDHIDKGLIKLPEDKGGYRSFTTDFKYGYASIPHRDFAFGTNWQMGEKGTTSNRRGQNTIQIFSEDGCYNNTCTDFVTGKETVHQISYDDPKDLLTAAPKEMTALDVPYESPKDKNLRKVYDAGPGKFAKVLTEFFTQVDYKALGAISHPSFGPTGLYRGRLDQAKVLLVADQYSHDDMFSGRALTGAMGQYFQNVFNAIGAKTSYGILNVLPVDSLGLDKHLQMEMALNQEVIDRRNNVLDAVLKEGKTQVILTLGEISSQVIAKYMQEKNLKIPVVNFASPIGANTTWTASWQTSVDKVKALKILIDEPAKTLVKDLQIIPRQDLPAYTRYWMGTSGDRAARSKEWADGTYKPNGNYYKIYAPKWVERWKANIDGLNAQEKASVLEFQKTDLAK